MTPESGRLLCDFRRYNLEGTGGSIFRRPLPFFAANIMIKCICFMTGRGHACYLPAYPGCVHWLRNVCKEADSRGDIFKDVHVGDTEGWWVEGSRTGGNRQIIHDDRRRQWIVHFHRTPRLLLDSLNSTFLPAPCIVHVPAMQAAILSTQRASFVDNGMFASKVLPNRHCLWSTGV